MRLFTCSYRAWGAISGLGQPVVTSMGLPKWLPEAKEWPRCWAITPTGPQLRMDPAAFEADYLARCERLGAARIARRLHEIARESGAESLILLCWEQEAERCHRSLFAAHWLATTGELITEVELTSQREEIKS